MAVVLDDSAGVLGHEEVRLARRHRSPGRHGDVHVEWVERSQWYTFSLSTSILSVGGSSLFGPGRQKEEGNHSQVVMDKSWAMIEIMEVGSLTLFSPLVSLLPYILDQISMDGS